MCNKAVDNYHNVLKLVLDCYITQKLCDKAVNTYHWNGIFEIYQWNIFLIAIRLKKCVKKQLINIYLAFIYIFYQFKTQKMRDRAISEYPLMLVYCPDKYETQRMFDEVVDDCLAVLKFFAY